MIYEYIYILNNTSVIAYFFRPGDSLVMKTTRSAVSSWNNFEREAFVNGKFVVFLHFRVSYMWKEKMYLLFHIPQRRRGRKCIISNQNRWRTRGQTEFHGDILCF